MATPAHGLQSQLESAESRLRAVLEAVRHYVVELSPDGVIQDINRTYDGTTIEQTVGSHVLNWLPPNERPRVQAAIAAVLAGAPRIELTTQGSGADGGNAWYRTCLTPIRSGDEITGVVMVGEDVTALHRAQIERERERRMAALGHVSASIAHDYNTLFTAMLCALDAARLVVDDPELLQQELCTLETAVSGAAKLTRHLTRISRSNPPSTDRGDLSGELRELAPLLEHVAGHGVEIQFSVCPGPVYVALSGTDLSQLMLNLVINAREAMPEGGRISISLQTEDAADSHEQYALLKVADTGPGIPAHVLEHMFEPYFSTKERGSGFGLATCYGIAVNAGGEISAGSASTGGALIEVRLPLQSTPHSQSEPPPATRKPSTARATLLLVDDNPELRATLRRHLSRIGFSVLVGCNGTDALDVVRRHPGHVDLVICDLVMRGGSGISLLRTLREERPDLRALAISGHAPNRDLEWLREHRVPLLRKPFSARELEERVRKLLG